MSIADFVRECLQTIFRLVPWPTEAGLRRVGNPGANSPVLLTGNYDLTVRRLRRVLAGQDVWLVVAPSGGINVWCAAAGGHLSTHQVVTALKTCGVAELVQHREVILPQLAATGVLALDVFRRARWKVRFGPVDAGDIPEYLDTKTKTDSMRRVLFPIGDRLQMAVTWAGPTSLVLGSLIAFLQPSWLLPILALIWLQAVGVFTLYDRLGSRRRPIFALASTSLALTAAAAVGAGVPALLAALIAPLFVTAVLTFDYTGSTPTEGGSHFEERNWKITLDPDRCEGVYRCWEVCPEACFEKLDDQRKVALAHDDRCIRCGACVVQCPKDALFFEDEAGERIEPDVIRKFKLNLLGQRQVDSG